MTVQETVFGMMRAYPTLYRTRVMALARLFDSYDSKWVNGELLLNEPRGNTAFLPYPPAKIIETGDARSDQDVVFHRLANAKAQFVYDNAHMLSKDPHSAFGKHSSIRFTGKRFDDMPEDVSQEWLEAAKELANAVRVHKYYPDTTYAAEYLKQQMFELEASAKLCSQFLERFKVLTPCPFERAHRLETVTREALALGFVLVPAISDGADNTDAARQ